MTTSAPLRDNSSAIPNPSVTSQTSLQKSNSILKKQLEMKFNSTNSAPTKLDVAILEDPNATTVEYGNKSNSMLRNYNYSVATTGKIPQRADSTRSGKSKLSLDNQVARTGRPLSIIATNVNPPTNVNSQQQLPPQPTSSPPHATLQHQTSTLSRTTPQQSNIHTPGNNSTAVIMEIDPVAGRPLQPSTAQFPVYKNDPFRGPNGSGGEYGTIKDAINETAKHIKENKGNVPNGQVEDLEPVVDVCTCSRVPRSHRSATLNCL
ncbi:hypothetical protein BKA69DRAFT_296407 [Paraphysoderma sedebokerense]|nr:hypothetical protein BKA69DRAFT_296407 [Paraphysoderma sedebokerense]